jgi:hypothetical protein
LFLCRSGEVRVLDLGIAWAAGFPPLTTPGVPLGTMPYMAPEQVATPQDIDARVDIFQLGLVLAQAVGGPKALPQHESLDLAGIEAALRERPPLAAVAPHVPPEAVEVIEKACAAKPDARYGTMVEFHDALARVLVNRRDRRRLNFLVGGGALVLGLAFGAGYLVHGLTGHEQASLAALAYPPAASRTATAATATPASQAGHPATQGEGRANKTDESHVSSESPPQEKDMTKLQALGLVAGMTVLSPNPAAHAKPPEQCQTDSDCKKKEACKSAGSLGNWCAEYDPNHCRADKYRFTKRAPDRLKGKCWVEALPDGSDTAQAY